MFFVWQLNYLKSINTGYTLKAIIAEQKFTKVTKLTENFSTIRISHPVVCLGCNRHDIWTSSLRTTSIATNQPVDLIIRKRSNNIFHFNRLSENSKIIFQQSSLFQFAKSSLAVDLQLSEVVMLTCRVTSLTTCNDMYVQFQLFIKEYLINL